MEFKKWVRAQWDRVAAVVTVVVGAVALLLGWSGVRDAIYPGQQIPYIVSGGMVALFLVGAGSVLWLSADLRDEWRKLDEIDEKLGQLLTRRGLGDADDRERQAEIDRLRFQLDALEQVRMADDESGDGPTGDDGRQRRRPLQPSAR